MLFLYTLFAQAQECFTELDQDYNCNSIDAVYETPVEKGSVSVEISGF